MKGGGKREGETRLVGEEEELRIDEGEDGGGMPRRVGDEDAR